MAVVFLHQSPDWARGGGVFHFDVPCEKFGDGEGAFGEEVEELGCGGECYVCWVYGHVVVGVAVGWGPSCLELCDCDWTFCWSGGFGLLVCAVADLSG